MKKDAGVVVTHILECIYLIEKYTENITENEFLKSIQLQDSVIPGMEIIGEAVKNISEEVKEKSSEI